MKLRLWLVTAAAGLVLADASIVTLALPELLRALDTTVEGVAAVIAVYTMVLAAALLPAERWMRRAGPELVGGAGFVLFGVASAACAVADSLPFLLVARSLQALGGAAGLVAAFSLIDGGAPSGRRHWLGAAVLSSAVGPALGGALTQAFDWRAIFIVQVPIAAVAALAALQSERAAAEVAAADRSEAERAAAAERAAEVGPHGTLVEPPDGAPAERAGGASTSGARRQAGADRAQSTGPASGGAGPASGGAGRASGGAGRASGGAGRASGDAGIDPAHVTRRIGLLAAAALACLSAALTAVLFLLVLLLVAGWAVSPLAAAATVTILPLAALAGSRIGGPARQRAAAGSLLVGAGVLALAWLPDANVAWTFVPQALAGVGMGMALPAFAGELLPERTPHDAAWLLTIRHAGIALVLIVVAPLIANQLDETTERAKERGVALVLDARLPPQDKLELAPSLLSGVDAEQPRAGLEKQLDEHRADFEGEERAVYDRLAERADETLVTAVGEAFRWAFVIAGGLAIVAAAALLLSGGGVSFGGAGNVALPAAAALVLAVPIGYVALHSSIAPEPVKIANPCDDREMPNAGGITGFLQDAALEAVDAGACRLRVSREELVLALADDDAAKRFEERHGIDPRSVTSVLGGLLNP